MKTIILLIALELPLWLPAQTRYDIVIDEIMADPSPQVGLPNNEWIELKNVSALPVNLQNWRIGDASGQSGLLPSFILQPDSFVIICTGSAVAALSVYGRTISVTSFPSLDNDGDQLFLKSADGRIIHSVNYALSWYGNDLKKEGGWTLEMIDTKNPCTGDGNWKASIHSSGGTPGRKNSVDAVNKDELPPQLKKAYTIDSITIVLVFDEPVDSLRGAMPGNYSIDGGLFIASAITLPPLFDKVQLRLNAPLQTGIVYNISAVNIPDCRNNIISNNNTARLGLPSAAMPVDVVINEILFNPVSGGYDYVEIYNRSRKIFDASKLYIANRNSSNAISNMKLLSASPVLIFPGDFIVVTENAENLSLHYLVRNPSWVLTLSSLPSFPDDKGYVILLNAQGDIIDEVDYLDDWHFKLIDNADGVALERIDPDGASNDPGNWHSAASTAGYGTPTYKNSQFRRVETIDAVIEVSPKLFSPDNDGFDDITTIQYKVNEPGFMANIIVFDAAGRAVRTLVRNALLGLNGYWNWDGLNDKGKKLPIGTYIVFTEIFNLQGKKSRFKNIVVLARRF